MEIYASKNTDRVHRGCCSSVLLTLSKTGGRMFTELLEKIKEYDTIIIHRHSNPDGDALGSQIGLKEIIKVNFPEKTVYMVGDMTARYAFMEGSEMDVIDDSVYEDALAIVLDTSAAALINDDRYKSAKPTAILKALALA